MQGAAHAAVHAAGPGSAPMPAAARPFFEPRFGRDFASVRVHTDGQASQAARAMRARAYTVGRDILFVRGEFSPRTAEGKRLLAHELTHVVQQGAGAPLRGDVTPAAASEGVAPVQVARAGQMVQRVGRQMLAVRAAGYTLGETATNLGCCLSTVFARTRQLGEELAARVGVKLHDQRRQRVGSECRRRLAVVLEEA
jgi:hypothetical protein